MSDLTGDRLEQFGLEPRPYLDIIRGWKPDWLPDASSMAHLQAPVRPSIRPLTSSSTPRLKPRLDTKLARARAQDEPVLCAHLLPGLDLLLCAVPGAHPPYPAIPDLRQRCLESILHALEQPLDRLADGGYWYEFNGLAVLIFASSARARTLGSFGAGLFSAR